MPLKILHLIYTYGVYGAEKHLLDLLPGLKKYDISCELIFICPKKSTPLLKDYCVKMNEMGIKTTLLPTSSKISYFLAAKRIASYLKANNIQIIHSHLFSADLIAVIVKKFFKKDIILLSTKHGYEEKYLLQYGLGNKKARHNVYFFISGAVISRIDHNLAVSKSLAEIYVSLKLTKDEMKFVHHGISLRSTNEKNITIIGHPKIMIVGRLSQIKGHIYIIQALPQIIKEFPELKLLILGEGPMKEKLVQEAINLGVLQHIEFIGFAAPEMYSPKCQVMVVPSLYESFGLVYIESFALKIPVVAFNTETARQIIENDETGKLVPSLDVNALARTIINLLQSPGERKRITENAYKKYLEYYNVERMVQETAAWYYSVLDAGNENKN